MKKKKMELDIVNPDCAGIDVGSKSEDFVSLHNMLVRKVIWSLSPCA